MTSAHLISVTTGIAIGIATTLAANGITAQAAIPDKKSVPVELVLGAGAETTFLNFMQTQACPVLDAKWSLSGSTACQVLKDLVSGGFSFEDDPNIAGEKQVRFVVQFQRNGTYVPDEPQ